MNDDVPKKANRPGTFDSARGKEAGSRRGKPRGIYALAKRHQKFVVDQLRHVAEHSSSETARARALSDLARLIGGAPPSARELGALPVDPPKHAATPADLTGMLRGLAGIAGAPDAPLLAELQRLAQPAASYTCPPSPSPSPLPAEEAEPATVPDDAQPDNVEPDASQAPPDAPQEPPHWSEGIEATSMLELSWRRLLP